MTQHCTSYGCKRLQVDMLNNKKENYEKTVDPQLVGYALSPLLPKL